MMHWIVERSAIGVGTVQWLGMARGTLGLFDEPTAEECVNSTTNGLACQALCLGLGGALGCVQICLTESCGQGILVSGPELKKALQEKGVSTSVPPSAPQETYGLYPWKVKATETETLQKSLNQKLAKDGFCLLNPDGVLGAGTCGAAQHYGAEPPTCQAFTAPKKCPAGGAPALTEQPSPSPVATAGAAKGGGGGGAVVLLVIGGLVLAGLAIAGASR